MKFYIVPDVIHDIMLDIVANVVHHVYPMAYTISCQISEPILLSTLPDVSFFVQIKLINAEIAAAKYGSPLYRKARLEDPSENLIRAHIATLEWNMMSRKFGMTAAELVRLQEKSVELLDLLKSEDLNKKMNVLKDEAANTLKELLQQLIDSKQQMVLAAANLQVNTLISLSQT